MQDYVGEFVDLTLGCISFDEHIVHIKVKKGRTRGKESVACVGVRLIYKRWYNPASF
ncbi:hypothetical protein H6503_04045 [Candidatus Woesearchaeota archaeon]|nr:hypothetical protein [Candidatus Woesearchaeota archaeon]